MGAFNCSAPSHMLLPSPAPKIPTTCMGRHPMYSPDHPPSTSGFCIRCKAVSQQCAATQAVAGL
eukprot:362930-Chlamydomonas_euryale.AAC.7